MPSVAVIIPAYNEQKLVGLLLQDLAAQTKLPEEIIVVDCKSEDRTVEKIDEFRDKLSIDVVQSEIRSAAAARNTGAKIARADYLLFIDADVRIPKNFIEEINKSLVKAAPDFLTPKYKTDTGSYLIDHFMVWGINLVIKIDIQLFHKVFGIGGVMCVRRTLHEQIGGFNNSDVTYDDIRYINKLNELKASSIYRPDLKVIVSSRRTKKDGRLAVLLRFISEDTLLSKRVIQPMMSKADKDKKYGHYDS